MPLGSLDMSYQDIRNALRPGAAGDLSLQQLPYDCPDSSFEFATDCDVLKPAVVNPYGKRSRVRSKKKQQRDQVARPTPVPNLDDVQPFMPIPDFVVKPGSELEALLTSPHIQNPYPYPGNIGVLPSYRNEPPESTYSNILREHVKHALAYAWKYDPFRCSVKGAFEFSQDLDGKPHHGLTEEEYNWATGGKLKLVRKARCTAQVDVKQARETYKWTKNVYEDDEVYSLDGSDLDREIEEFYGPDGTDRVPIDEDSDEGFSEPNAITTTIVSLPEKSLMEEGVTPGGIFQDSGISMDEGYAKYSRAHSLPNTAKEITGKVPSDWPTFNAHVAPLRTPKQKGPWLGLLGDQKQCGWPGRRQGPYDLKGLGSDGVNQMVNDPSSNTTHEHPLSADVTIAVESTKRAQISSDFSPEEVNDEPSKAAPQSFGQKQPPNSHPNVKNLITNEEVKGNEVSLGAAHSTSEERLYVLRGSIVDGGDSGPSGSASHAIPGGPQIENDASAYAYRSIPNDPFATPVHQGTRQIQQVQVAIPVTPETVNIHLTPEHNNDMDLDDASDGSLNVGIPNSPTTDTQKCQSALGRYRQEVNPYTDFARQKNSIMHLDGSKSEEDPLTSLQSRLSHPEGHAVFRKAVELHQFKNDAAFTLSPPKVSRNTPSPSKAAPIPCTPAYADDSTPFRPVTPFQLRTPAHPDFESPGTPTPAPKVSNKAKEKSVMNVFNSPKLGSRSPERTQPNSEIVVNPTTALAAAAATGQHRGSSCGNQGLLFQKAKKNQNGTKNVLSALKLSPQRGGRSGGSGYEKLDDYEDELAGPGDIDPGAQKVKGGRKAGHAVAVPKVRSRDDMIENEDEDGGVQIGDVQIAEGSPRKRKKMTKTMRSVRTADACDC